MLINPSLIIEILGRKIYLYPAGKDTLDGVGPFDNSSPMFSTKCGDGRLSKAITHFSDWAHFWFRLSKMCYLHLDGIKKQGWNVTEWVIAVF